ncbi:MAG: hypothetical protein IPK34_00370 [Ramlibacter sp.]|nr:hypothetical protein [Ramlibacter sp.]
MAGLGQPAAARRPALACMAYNYIPGPPRAAVVDSLAQLAAHPLEVEMAAGGQTTLLLPLADARGEWSVRPDPLDAVAVHSSVLRGEGRQRLSRHVFDYRLLNAAEVARIESGPDGLRDTRWRNARVRDIALRLTYRVGGKPPREFAATLKVYPRCGRGGATRARAARATRPQMLNMTIHITPPACWPPR